MASADRTQIPGVGDHAPGFRLRDLQGGWQALDDLVSAGPVLLAFFKITCPVCQLTLPFLDRIHKDAQGALRVYGVSQDDAEWTRDFNRRFGITFPTLLDSAGDDYPAGNAFGITTVPTLFLVERHGAISWLLEGFVKREIQSLAGKFGVNPFRPDENVPEWKAG